MDKAPKKLGIYVHIPFCAKKCNYCDFASFPVGFSDSAMSGLMSGNDASDMAVPGSISGSCAPDIPAYFEKLEQETVALSEFFMRGGSESFGSDYRVDSVFFGGGTPSLVDEGFISCQMELVRRRFNLISGAEISIETNPGTLTEEKLSAYSLAGFNRLSLGVQSLDDAVLKVMGRIHDAKEARQSLRLTRRYFNNINIDLMMGVPGQSLIGWLDSLKWVLEWEPEHLSFYSLQLEEGTPFYRDYVSGRLKLPAWEENREMYHRGLELIKAAGYLHYEVSNAAKPGFECRHNLKYWNMEEYLGLGMAAHSFMDNKRFEAWELFGEAEERAAAKQADEAGGSAFGAAAGAAFGNAYGSAAGSVFGSAAGIKCSSDASQSLSEARRELFERNLRNISTEAENGLKGDFIFTQLRLIKGLDTGLYRKLFGSDFESDFAPVLKELYAEGLLQRVSPDAAASDGKIGGNSSRIASAADCDGFSQVPCAPLAQLPRIAFTSAGLDNTNPVMERLLSVL